MRKKVDSRIRTLVENGVHTRQRSLFIIVGDKGKEQVVNLHYMLSKAVVKSRPSVLWCYKKELYLSSHRKKRLRQMKKMMQRGLIDPEKEDPFALFIASTNIRYCYYSETHKILGNTFGMCVLQDFEGLTPNLLARTMETVEGGGIIIMLMSSLTSLSQLYTLTMDVHARFRTESHSEVTGRFNERFLLSLASCSNCCVMDDEFNVLPLSSHIKTLQPVSKAEADEDQSESAVELRELKESLKDVQPMGALVATCRTLDQGKAVVTFLDSISEKTLRATVALTAARGRGKSAALGVAVAGAVALGYSNIFVTAPSPENLKTLFEFVFKGFDAMEYKEHIDYEMVESTNPEFNKAIVRVNVFRNHRQTIQYIQPHHADRIQQAELLVIDEAAAIPLPVVKSLLGPYLVFLCSTVNGYEGTGRSLSLKLIHQLRDQSRQAANASTAAADGAASSSGRVLREVELSEPIRYAAGDRVETWLNDLLCLNAATNIPPLQGRLPRPDECDLYYVNRDTLFSYHKASELFLQRMMALYVASHYKNTPNDLQLMSDAPAHHLFVLLGPVEESQTSLPDILCVIQVCLEGHISKASSLKNLSQGIQPTGDLLPWTLSQQFQDAEFPSLSGARIVRIAVHPDCLRAGYGSRAVELLIRYYEGQLTDLADEDEMEGANGKAAGVRANGVSSSSEVKASAEEASLLEEQIKPRSDLPPLLLSAAERAPERLHYLGVSFGLSQSLLNFWRRLLFTPLYVRQTASDVTGEHTCIVLRSLATDDVIAAGGKGNTSDADVSRGGESPASWLQPFVDDFRRRFISLLGFSFRSLPPALALSLLDPKIDFSEQEAAKGPSAEVVLRGANSLISPYDMKRLESYANNLVDYHLILDLVPTVARLYFLEQLPVSLSYAQAAILISLGLQHSDLAAVETHLKLPGSQILALFNKAMRKLHGSLHSAAAREIEAALPRVKEVSFSPHQTTVDEDLKAGASAAMRAMNEKLGAAGLRPEDLQQFAIAGKEAELDEAIAAAAGKLPSSGLLSVKSKENSKIGANEVAREKSGKKNSQHSSKRKR